MMMINEVELNWTKTTLRPKKENLNHDLICLNKMNINTLSPLLEHLQETFQLQIPSPSLAGPFLT